MQLQPPTTTASGATRRRILAEPRHLAPRNVDVWLPPAAAGQRLPVIYMHDGQNLFDHGHSYAGVPWEIDRAMERLIASGRTAGAIVVGVWNSGIRWREYGPQRPLEPLAGSPAWEAFLERAGGPPVSDLYLAFLVEELKPFVDAHFLTRPDQASTMVMGSSMGGLISLYALERYPEVFGAAGCVSTHWPAGGPGLVDAMGAALPPPGRHRLYFDYGTEGLDAAYEPLQRRFDAHLEAAGYRPGRDFVSHKFAGADHSEPFWRDRAHIPLEFLLGAAA